MAKFQREKAFLKGNLICYISGIEGCKNLKLNKVSLQICQNLLGENQAKKFSILLPF